MTLSDFKMNDPPCAILLRMLTFLQVIALLSCQRVYKSDFILRADTVETVIVRPDEVITLSLPHVPSPALYAMIQFHTQKWNLTISSSNAFDMASSKCGTNVGLVVPVNGSHEVYLKSSNVTTNLTAIGFLHFLNNYDPIPGGCNQIFNLERDPNIELTYSTGRTDLLFQWANQAAVTDPKCDDKQVQKGLEYDIYAYFLDPASLSEDDYIDAVKELMSATSIGHQSHKVATMSNGLQAKPQLSVVSESSRGVIYSIVARINQGAKSHATPYVAVSTYSCSFDLGDCSVKLSAEEILLIIVSTVVGGFLLIFGHRKFQISQFIFGYLLIFITVYLSLMTAKTTSDTNSFVIAGCLGLVGGVAWLSMWWLCAFPIAAVFVPGLCTGYLVSATVFFTPFGDLEWWERDENYALSFVCVVLLYTVLLLAYSKFLNIISCCIMGAYMLLMMVAIPVHSSLRLIIVHTVQRQTLGDFGKVKIIVPTLTADIVLMVMWPILIIAGIVFQLYRQKGLPDFELPKRKLRRRHVVRERPARYVGDSDEEQEGNGRDGPIAGGESETERLLPRTSSTNRQQEPPTSNYHSVDSSPTRGENSRRKHKNLLR